MLTILRRFEDTQEVVTIFPKGGSPYKNVKIRTVQASDQIVVLDSTDTLDTFYVDIPSIECVRVQRPSK